MAFNVNQQFGSLGQYYDAASLGLHGYITDREAGIMDNGWQLYLADRANAQELERWRLNNAYNSPSAQMQRLKEAGLNPNLIYGSGSASTGNSSSPAGVHQASASRRASSTDTISGILNMVTTLFGQLGQSLDAVNSVKKSSLMSEQTRNLRARNIVDEFRSAYFGSAITGGSPYGDYGVSWLGDYDPSHRGIPLFRDGDGNIVYTTPGALMAVPELKVIQNLSRGGEELPTLPDFFQGRAKSSIEQGKALEKRNRIDSAIQDIMNRLFNGQNVDSKDMLRDFLTIIVYSLLKPL